MNRTQLEHIIRASAGNADATDIVIIGSQALLGTFVDAPEELLISMEADVFPRDRPEDSILIDGAIGERSIFHETFGYYAHGVAETTAILPEGWRSRLIPICNDNTRGATGWCLEVHDLAVSKLIAGREKDLEYLAALFRHRLASPEITHQLNTLLDKHIQQRMPALRLPDDRSKLVDAVIELAQGSEWSFCGDEDDDYEPPESLEATARKLTAADVETALRVYVRLPSPTVGISFQRTLRIPDDGNTYPLPAGLGNFPLRSVDDYADTLPEEWVKRGGVLMPMYQSEALWIRFSSSYPFATKIASGKINAVSGKPWTPDLQKKPQNYVVLPKQPWLDGFSIGEGLIRQFVAMPLGDGYSVEEQLTGKADIGGIQIQAYPMNAETYFREKMLPNIPTTLEDLLPTLFADQLQKRREKYGVISCRAPLPSRGPSMGLGMGGQMRQEIYEDTNPITAWDQTQTRRCFIHLCNSLTWRQFTHTNPPHPPLTAKEYQSAGIPWFDYYRDDQTPLKGSKTLAKLKSVHQLGQEKNTQPLPENTPITPQTIIQYGNTRRPGEIREFLDLP